MSNTSSSSPASGRALAGLALAAMGVVYGDIGTSPLYAIKECFGEHFGLAADRDNVLGILSLVFWALNFVVAFKYIALVLRADNRGEGGILALLALLQPRKNAAMQASLVGLGLFGAALLYGDGVITPAISVLGAMEGLEVAAPGLAEYVVPVTCVILFALFAIQKYGTAAVGRLFGPVMLTWFVAIALLGARAIAMEPGVLAAINPMHAIHFFAVHGWKGYLILGSVVLVVTGGEALYADMGHFGRRPIRLAWFGGVLPALLLNYFGQGALLLHDPAARENPFFALVPAPLLYPMVILATLAAVVASQALISGAFSLTRQAVQLGYVPRVSIIHTSTTEMGQIYIPAVNRLLMLGCLGLVIGFGTSSKLAAAYGIAVTGTMLITTLLFHRVTRDLWKWSRAKSWAVTIPFLIVDSAFLGANAIKVMEGGWFPLAVAGVIYLMMTTWKRGRRMLQEAQAEGSIPMDMCVAGLESQQVARVRGTAVFLTSDAKGTPGVLLHHMKHNKVLHERVVLLSVLTEDVPQVLEGERFEVTELGQGFLRVRARAGFMESVDIPQMMATEEFAKETGFKYKPMETSFYLGRESLRPTGSGKMAAWRKKLFIVMSRNAGSAADFFSLPPNRVVEMGAQVQI
jgi:KUP system potassium uptake protein